ncbi:MAG: aryl-sulfate sulfotransferase [Planctomycetota bacterium]|nr:aryl-sulfate sulfotransferase [Planctomycetota bacterium]MDG2144616.1 aryl-sulfate sulfotransferase [Planctomycetota bacterium]
MFLSLLLALSIQDDSPQVGLRYGSPEADPGYILIAPLKSKSTFLVKKADGEVAHHWQSSELPGNSVYLMDNGDILRATAPKGNEVFRGGGAGGGFQRISASSELLWEFSWSDDMRRAHHDFEPMPNGNILLISWEYKSTEQAFEAGRNPDEISEDGLWPDYVVELQPPTKLGEKPKVVWEWHAWDHLVQDQAKSKANFGVVGDSPGRIDLNGDLVTLSKEDLARAKEVEEDMKGLGYIGDDDASHDSPSKDAEPDLGDDVEEKPEGREKRRKKSGDWLHTNGIDYDPVNDVILLSSRVFSEIWMIDHSTTTAQAASSSGGRFGQGGDLLWRWGNPQKYDAGLERDQTLFRQHDARFIPDGFPGAGNVTVYNNGEGRPGGRYSTVEELVLPWNKERDGFPKFSDAFGPSEAAWKAGSPKSSGELFFFSSFISGAERLESGNTMICVGASGRVIEVSPEGKVVWEYISPFQEKETAGPRGGPDRPGPPGGPPDRAGRPPGGGPGAGKGRNADLKNALFRATPISPLHPGVLALGQ